jgi:hypothetical protein
MSGTRVEEASVDAPETKGLIAPVWHTIVMLLLLGIPVALGVLRLINGSAAPPQAGPIHPANLWKFYAQTMIYEWILVGVAWIGIRLKQIKMRELIGGRWPTIGHAFADLIIGAAICVTMFYLGDQLGAWLKPANGNSINVVPQDGFEMALWIALSATAGVARNERSEQTNSTSVPSILPESTKFRSYYAQNMRERLILGTVASPPSPALGTRSDNRNEARKGRDLRRALSL